MAHTLILRMTNEIDQATREGRVDQGIMFLVEARDRIEYLETALAAAACETERLFRYINKTRGEFEVEIVKKRIGVV